MKHEEVLETFKMWLEQELDKSTRLAISKGLSSDDREQVRLLTTTYMRVLRELERLMDDDEVVYTDLEDMT